MSLRLRLSCLGLTCLLAACGSDSHDEPASGGSGGGGSGGGAGAGASAGSGGDSGGEGGSGGAATTPIDRSGLTDVGVTDPLDYADPNLWVCRPGNDPNECTRNLDVTVFEPDGTTHVEPHVVAEDPAFDCFYVYPTVDLTSGSNTTDFSDISHVLDPLMSQGARFSSMCEVYAPLYRQQAIGAGGDGGAIGLMGDAALALSDVEDAFDYYLQNFNRGRKFVLMGHSQGTLVLTQLIAARIDDDPALREQMISALLIGGGPQVPEGELVGGSFQNIPACSSPGETGCVMAHNMYAVEAPPASINGLFGIISGGQETICTTPGPLANRTGRSAAYTPRDFATEAFVPDLPEGSTRPDFDTPFAKFPETFRAECVRKDGYHYLEITRDPPADDQRTVAPYRSSVLESIGFGLHLTDYNLVLDELMEAVRLQAEAALQ